MVLSLISVKKSLGERGGSVVECRTPEREVRGSRPTSAVLCPWARHFTPRKYWLITQEAMAPSRHDWKIVDRDVKPQHNQIKKSFRLLCIFIVELYHFIANSHTQNVSFKMKKFRGLPFSELVLVVTLSLYNILMVHQLKASLVITAGRTNLILF